MPAALGELHRFIFHLDSPIGAAINTVIVWLFALGLLDALYALGRLVWEGWVIRGASQRLAATSPRATKARASLVTRLALPAQSLLGRRMTQILDLRAAGLSPREALERLTHQHLGRLGAMARYITTTLTVLGLLGTVFGLSVAVAETQLVVTGQFNLKSMQALAEALLGTLGGMKTAFATTLAGLLAALLLSVVNQLVLQTRASVSRRLEEFFTCKVLPALQMVDPEADAAAKAFAESLRGAAEKLDGVAEAVTSAATTYHTGSTVLAQAVERIASVATSFEKSVADLSSQQRGFTEVMVKTGETIAAVETAVRQQYLELRELSEASGKLLSARLDKLDQDSTSLRDSNDKLTELYREFSRLAASYDEGFKAALSQNQTDFQGFLAGLDRELRDKAAAGLDGYLKDAHTRLEGLLRSQEELVQQLVEGSRSHLSRLIDQNQATFSAVTDLVLDVQQSVGSPFGGVSGNHRPGGAP